MGEVEFQFQENITGIGYFIKICKKSAATEGFFLPSPLLRTKILLNCFADENYSRDQNLCGHFEETVIYHFKKIEGAVASFERIVQTFKGHFLLLYNKSIQLHFEEKIIIISKRQRQGIAIPLARR